MEEKGHCKHGEFILNKGCPQCIAELRQKGGAIMLGDKVVATLSPEPETSLVNAPGANNEVISYYNEALKLQARAESKVIATPDDIKAATEDLSDISRLKKAMEGKKREYLDPLKIQAEAIRETYSTLMDPILAADRITRDKILAYNKEQVDKRREEERINALKLEVAEAERKLKGKTTEPVELIQVSPDVPKHVSTDRGATGQRDNWTWEVTDFSLVPDDYKMINSGTLTPVVKASKGKITIPGVRIFNEPIITVTPR